MCRLLLYIGNKSSIFNILFKPEHSLIKQTLLKCYSPDYPMGNSSDHDINIEGFGILVLKNNKQLLYKSTKHIWNDNNLINLCKFLNTECFMAHIRGKELFKYNTISYNNCHPFIYNNYSMIHNGIIGNFNKIKKILFNNISNKFKKKIKGNTDSEYLFYLILSHLFFNNLKKYTLKKLTISIITVFKNIININKVPNSFNIIFSDKQNIIITRFSNIKEPPSLYINIHNKSIIICSEPIYKNNKFLLIKKNSIIIINILKKKIIKYKKII